MTKEESKLAKRTCGNCVIQTEGQISSIFHFLLTVSEHRLRIYKNKVRLLATQCLKSTTIKNAKGAYTKRHSRRVN